MQIRQIFGPKILKAAEITPEDLILRRVQSSGK
jgi:hypothetical protein